MQSWGTQAKWKLDLILLENNTATTESTSTPISAPTTTSPDTTTIPPQKLTSSSIPSPPYTVVPPPTITSQSHNEKDHVTDEQTPIHTAMDVDTAAQVNENEEGGAGSGQVSICKVCVYDVRMFSNQPKRNSELA